jgi:hypothetical protein
LACVLVTPTRHQDMKRMAILIDHTLQALVLALTASTTFVCQFKKAWRATAS